MILSLPYGEFKKYVLLQMSHFFPDGQNLPANEYDQAFDRAIDRTSYCFSRVNMDSYFRNGEVHLNHLHANQYAAFLWFLSNTVWTEFHDEGVANKLYCLNRALNGLSCSYEARLPKVFLLLHIVGTVLGKADYSDFFVAGHGCTVGAHHGIYPKIGRGVAMLPHSSIIGACTIGDRVSVGVNATIYERDVPDNTTVYVDGNTGQVCSRHGRAPWAQHLFNMEI
jgi:serine O-acetyltransferase